MILMRPCKKEAEKVKQLPSGVTRLETYVRDTLSVGDVVITIYRHDSLTSQQVLKRLI